MPADSEFSFRAARLEDADTVFNITKASIAGLSRDRLHGIVSSRRARQAHTSLTG